MLRLHLLAFAALPALAQSLTGVIDIHVHADPDSLPRSIDAIDLAKLAKQRGMRGLVLKNHYEATASLAWLVRKEVPGIEIFGGIDLNLTVGGINPAAVERMTMVKGGLGRVVWMPTYDAENQVRYSKENRPFVAVAKDGQLLPATKEVIAAAARHNLTLETGHSSPEECLMILREAQRQGVRHRVVTHALTPPVRMNVEQMREAARFGQLARSMSFFPRTWASPTVLCILTARSHSLRRCGRKELQRRTLRKWRRPTQRGRWDWSSYGQLSDCASQLAIPVDAGRVRCIGRRSHCSGVDGGRQLDVL